MQNIEKKLLAAEIAIVGLADPLSYKISDSQVATLGSEVSVDLGKRKARGWIVKIISLEEAESNLKAKVQKTENKQLTLFSPPEVELKPILDVKPAFLPDQIELFSWVAEYYGISLAEVLDTALPLRPKETKRKKKATSSVKEENLHTTTDSRKLTSGQLNAYNAISQAVINKTFSPFLLFGITGSGKTEIYIRCIQKALEQSRSSLLIVPEIALTPQLIDQLESRLDQELAILHSQVGKQLRWSHWEGLLTGRIKVAIGARSAVFAPLVNLGLIIVDEEHESSYKQSDGVRYHGRDLAVIRAKFSNCPVVLGSATPSFESLLNAQAEKYKILEISERATSRPLPSVEVVDLKQIKRKEMLSENISPPLYQALTQTLEAKEQAVILYNRRGFSSYLQCDSCGEAVCCPHCSVTFTYHQKKSKLICHYCGETSTPPKFCPQGLNPDTVRIEGDKDDADFKGIGNLSYRGSGTEKVVEELACLFPDAFVLRMDRDTVGKKGAYREILGSMRSGKADILVGTQMIAKGHDLPGVTLVGIIDADVGLHLPDFRSSEKTYQLITQASGRAGRGETSGRVILQTREINHPAIVALSTGRFKAFARYQLEQRKEANYPPYVRLMRLVVSSPDSQDVFKAAQEIKSMVYRIVEEISLSRVGPAIDSNKGNFFQIIGPAPAPLERLRNRYRWHIFIKAESSKLMSQMARILNVNKQVLKKYKDLRLAVDLDPFDLL
jgi:primosomal protein N' (replication factor Y) (superfamily II helicase)